MTVRVSPSAPSIYRAGQFGSAVAFTIIRTEEMAAAAGHPVGCVLYTVEYEDGSDQQIPAVLCVRESPNIQA